MAGYSRSEKISTVDIDAPKLSHPVDRVRNGLEVLRETSRGHKVIDFTVLTEDLRDT